MLQLRSQLVAVYVVAQRPAPRICNNTVQLIILLPVDGDAAAVCGLPAQSDGVEAAAADLALLLLQLDRGHTHLLLYWHYLGGQPQHIAG